MDFEFTQYRRTETVIISGAVAQNRIEVPVRKFEGLPLIISPQGEVRKMNPTEGREIKSFLTRIFRLKKPEQLKAVLTEIERGMVKEPMSTVGKKIVLWAGHTDRTILKKLGVNRTMINMSA